MKKITAMFVSILIMVTLCSCVRTDKNIENYPADMEKYQASLFMPNLDEIGDFKDAKYFVRKDESIFPEYSMQLVLKYDKETFLKEKKRLESAYTYLDNPQKIDDGNYTIPIEEFSFAGFDFKIAVFEDTYYPKKFGMVGVSDEKYEIAYLWIYAVDLDYICEADENEIKAMSEFMEYHFSLE